MLLVGARRLRQKPSRLDLGRAMPARARSSAHALDARTQCPARSRPARWWSKTSKPARFRRARAVSSAQSRARGRSLRADDGAHRRRRRSRSNCATCGRGCARCRRCRCCRRTICCFARLIVKFCADRQLSVDETVVSYLASRIERSFAAARQAVELLDTEALRLRPAGDPGAGGGTAAQRLIRWPRHAALTARPAGTSMSLKCHGRWHMVCAGIRLDWHGAPEPRMDRNFMESAQAIEMKEKEQVPKRRRAIAHQPGALHQPRAVLAAFQPPGARGGRQSRPSRAGAGAVPVDFRQ